MLIDIFQLIVRFVQCLQIVGNGAINPRLLTCSISSTMSKSTCIFSFFDTSFGGGYWVMQSSFCGSNWIYSVLLWVAPFRKMPIFTSNHKSHVMISNPEEALSFVLQQKNHLPESRNSRLSDNVARHFEVPECFQAKINCKALPCI